MNFDEKRKICARLYNQMFDMSFWFVTHDIPIGHVLLGKQYALNILKRNKDAREKYAEYCQVRNEWLRLKKEVDK